MKKINETNIMKTTIEKNLEGTMKGVMKLMALSTAALVCSSGLYAAGKGTSGAQFLRIDAGARGAAMSGAVSPVIDDATAIYYNPAGLSRMEQREAELAYNAYFKD